jgi:hypothetical protein
MAVQLHSSKHGDQTLDRFSQKKQLIMKTHTPSHLSIRPLSHLILAVTAGVVAGTSAQASDVAWSSAGTSVSWNNGANWGGTAPANDTTTDIADFGSASYAFQPQLDADTLQAVNGISFTGGTTAAVVTIGAATSSGASSGVTSLGSSTITLASIGSQVVGEEVTGTGIKPGTFITAISGNQITLSNATTSAISSGAALTFTPTLTVGSGGITVGSSIHTVETLATPIVLASSQTWTNNSGGSSSNNNYLVVNSVFLGASQTLTLNAVTKDFSEKAFVFNGQDALTGSGTLRINTGRTNIGNASTGDTVANPNFSGTIILESGGALAAVGGSTGGGSAAKLFGTGTLIINGGSLGATGNIGNGTSATNGLFSGNQIWNGDFATSLTNATMYMGSGAVSLGTVAGGSVQRTITSNNDFGGINLVIGGVISNGVTATGITKAGVAATAGKLTLNGVNTYTGQTIIKQGAIVIGASGSIASSSKIIVGDTLANNAAVFDVTAVTSGYHIVSGQTLAGFGTVSGSTARLTIDAGAFIAPGNGNVGQLSISDSNSTAALTLQGTYLWSLGALKDNTTGTAGTDFSQILLTSTGANLVLGGNVTLSFLNSIADPNSTDAYWTTNHTWLIISGTTGVTNTGSTQFVGVTNGTWTDGNFSTAADANGNVELTYTAVPEPSTWAMLVGGFGLLIGVQGMRRRRMAA